MAGPGQHTAKQMRPGHCTNHTIPGVLGWSFYGQIHNLHKVSIPCWKYICSRAIFHLSQSQSVERLTAELEAHRLDSRFNTQGLEKNLSRPKCESNETLVQIVLLQVVQTLDGAIHQINHYLLNKHWGPNCVVHWIEINSENSTVHLLNNWGFVSAAIKG